jgi:hypothetical protein
MRIASDGNVYIATTTEASDDVGHALLANGRAYHTADGTYVGLFNRKTSDGEIVQFRKDNTVIGTIGAKAGDMIVGTGDAALRFSDASDIIEPWNVTSNTGEDNHTNLGWSGGRFKDLYLGGGLYVGGTGTANKLDDYEEGTFTPEITDGISGRTHITQSGSYTKVGTLCKIKLRVRLSAGTATSNQVGISGLPFTSASGDGDGLYFPFVHSSVVNSTTSNPPTLYIQPGTTSILMYNTDGLIFRGNELNSASSANFYIVGTYLTA